MSRRSSFESLNCCHFSNLALDPIPKTIDSILGGLILIEESQFDFKNPLAALADDGMIWHG